jgi:hypothetical protein
MYGRMKQAGANAIQQWKLSVVPALVVGGWLMLFTSVVTPMSQPTSLAASIDKVLSHPEPVQPATNLVAMTQR